MAINLNEIGQSVGAQFQGLNGLHPGLWPLAPRIASAMGVLIVVVALGWYFQWDGQMTSIETGQAEEVKLRGEYKQKLQQAINLDALKEQRKLVQQYVATMEKQLPSQAEMAALLADINQAGQGRGLAFDSFIPGLPAVKDYYAELPIAIKIQGNYHDLGQFVADIAKLPRIVTLNNLNIIRNADGVLILDVTAKTFRYLNRDEVLDQAEKKKKEPKK
ncbi:type 4a pilus biogenesis protein PilO [Undibacterium sp. Ji83W]|uniref:type 4a pilus biogenesis protein PilO n=1 Tax=Undibacterium sp. Ji83W TaxID=3413043 RepID=UPI003BF20A56